MYKIFMHDDRSHVPVLSSQVSDLLQPQTGQTCLDATVGRGGHAALIIPLLGPAGRYIGLDMDEQNADFCRRRFADHPNVTILHANFRDAPTVLADLNLAAVDLLLADLGFASTQMDLPDRGFSFTLDGPLDMRLDLSLPETAADLVNKLPERELADLIYQFGEERFSRRIAQKIIDERRRQPILTTGALANLVRQAYGRRGRAARIDPATRTFMALRIAVNDELGSLESLLGHLPSLLRPGGRAAIISFHSLEDRPVKHALLELERTGSFRRLTRKPLRATDSEQQINPRSRSAKLRAIEYVGLDVQADND